MQKQDMEAMIAELEASLNDAPAEMRGILEQQMASCRQAIAMLERAEPAAGGEGPLLYQILRVRPVAQQPQGEPVRPVEQRREQLVERFATRRRRLGARVRPPLREGDAASPEAGSEALTRR